MPASFAGRRSLVLAVAGAVLLVAVALARIGATYRVFVQTFDEPAHVATGMEWLDRHRYTYEALHPPLARVAVALGPYLDGIRSTDLPNMWDEGHSLLYARDTYWRNLTLARLGVLPFFLVACVAVFAWATRLNGPLGGITALFLFTTLPAALAHAGLATTDLPVTATFTLALIAMIAWLDRPSLGRSVALGVGVALAALTKLSVVLFLPVAWAVLLLCRVAIRKRGLEPPPARGNARARATGALAAALCFMLVVWAMYRFSFGAPLPVPNRGTIPHTGMLASPPPGHALVPTVVRGLFLPIYPAPEWFRGVGKVVLASPHTLKTYLLGEPYTGSRWLFFPVALLVKTPLPFLLLSILGVIFAQRRARATGDWTVTAPGMIAAGLLGAAMLSGVNLGLRHILPMLPLLAVAASGAVVELVRSPRGKWARWAVAALLAWQAGESVTAHPDYLAYFNELARRHPERVLIESDLDWGQDLARLGPALRDRHVTSFYLAYHGTADPARHGLPAYKALAPDAPVTGWVAASIYSVQIGEVAIPQLGGYGWLQRYRPCALVGRSIWLYHISATGQADSVCESRVGSGG